MKKIYKILFITAVFFTLTAALFAGGTKELEPTEEEKEAGWRYFMPIGFKLKRPAFFDAYGDNLDTNAVDGKNEAPESPLYAAYEYKFFSDELIEIYTELINDKKLSREEKHEKFDAEIAPKIKPIYSLIVLKTPLIENKPLEEITGYPYNDVIRKTKEFTQILSIAEFNAEGLSAESAEIYKTMISQVKPIRDTITCTDPISPESVMLGIKNLKFETIDLEGGKVTSDILKNYDVTMINIWATWCPPCRAELPEIAKLYESFKDRNCNIIGITGDVSPKEQDALETAKKLIKDAGCNYTVVQNNESFKPLFRGLVAWPMTIFVDKKGNIIASSEEDLIVGSRTFEEFTEAMEKAINTVKK
ncbi:TlpA disulfide reductase family protein [Treponema pedis]|uniref:TlpA disulfide reductase family protein n=1 Tax=Treponema pedis TaxID=409322 RepID=UPI00040A9911|nr:TlpA disulfide reductase family protein [Treponema pedis]